MIAGRPPWSPFSSRTSISICIFTIETIGRVRYVNSHANSTSRFDRRFTYRSGPEGVQKHPRARARSVLYRFFTIELRRRVRYVNYCAKRTSALPAKPIESECAFEGQQGAKRPRRAPKEATKWTLICVFTIETTGRVGYVNLHAKSTSRFDR